MKLLILSTTSLVALLCQVDCFASVVDSQGGSQTQTETNANEVEVTLRLEITGYKAEEGVLRVSVFANAQGFPSDDSMAIASQSVGLKSKQTDLEFSSLSPHKQYAVAVLHDKNGNGRLDKNFFGIPTEGITVSGSPNLWLGEPKFSECSVTMSKGLNELKLVLHYF